MQRILRVHSGAAGPDAEREAHRRFRLSMILSGTRCLVTYLLVPIAVPIIGFAGVVATPISVALCCLAAVNGVASLRRFWASNHRARWIYTIFIAFVFVVLTIAFVTDITRLVSHA